VKTPNSVDLVVYEGMNVNRATRHEPREIFPREDTDFTPWLEDNIDYLTDVLDLTLSVVEREKDTPTGFSIDLAVEEEDGEREGIIECQIEESDHDHLGKVLTYSTAFESEIAIWIVQEPRYEHKKTIEWLNESTEKYFYLIQIEAIKVKGEVAPLFTPISVPSSAAKKIGETKREPSERDLKQEKFWEELLERSSGSFPLFSNISPKQQGWISKGAGKSGVLYRYRIRNDWGDAGIYIDTNDKDLNEEIFDTLYEERDEIEDGLPFELDWQRLEDSRACRITHRIDGVGLSDEKNWPKVQEEMIEQMQEISSVFSSRIQNLDV
jgi:hypothetical protein